MSILKIKLVLVAVIFLLPITLFSSEIVLKNSGAIIGYNYIDYNINIKSGQKIRVDLKSSNSYVFFNVNPPNNENSIFVGQNMAKPNQYEARLYVAGAYIVRIYFTRNEARRDHLATFDIDIVISTDNKIHPSWDVDKDGINDCEKDGSCDHTVDYSIPRRRK